MRGGFARALAAWAARAASPPGTASKKDKQAASKIVGKFGGRVRPGARRGHKQTVNKKPYNIGVHTGWSLGHGFAKNSLLIDFDSNNSPRLSRAPDYRGAAHWQTVFWQGNMSVPKVVVEEIEKTIIGFQGARRPILLARRMRYARGCRANREPEKGL